MPDIEDIIEEELLEDQEENSSKKEKILIEENSPKESTSYKDRLIEVYDELTNIKKEDLDNKIQEIKQKLKSVIKDLEESERKIHQLTTNKIDKEMEQDRDLHYLPKTKKSVSKEASDGYFSKKNMIILGLSAFSILLIVILFAVVLL